MRPHLTAAVAGLFLFAPTLVHAGLYYSGEEIAELPSQWRGYLIDQRQLRTIAVKPTDANPVTPIRKRYQDEADKLAKSLKNGTLSPDEIADLGAVYLRLGETAKAIEVLSPAQRDHPQNFRIAANLGTAWQLSGDLDQAAACLEQSAQLAPGRYQRAEKLHLRLVRLRRTEPRDWKDVDDLFGVNYVGADGKYAMGRLDDAQRKALPDDAPALVQQLGLWLPTDGRLLWQMGELAAVNGDVTTAAAILDGCVTEFGLRSPELRLHRKMLRQAADALAASSDPNAQPTHDANSFPLKPKSSRPLLHKTDLVELPPIDPKGVNVLPWTVVTETVVDRKFHPDFPPYLKELDGKQIQLTGYMQPLTDDQQESSDFLLIEYPVGCWYCEMPQVTGIVLVELQAGKTREYTRGKLRITGTLKLNAKDPEDFLYTIKDAKAVQMDE
ncbi:MAG TPA: DUF3299 domain-containing protein [Gemmataceae bacterium]|nr:DUF3299 domain-containing protein [Gemmataceae bacterium]